MVLRCIITAQMVCAVINYNNAQERMFCMKKFSLAALVLAIAGVLAIPVMAEEGQADADKPAKKDKMEAFKKADANADGKLSLDEFKTMSTKGNAEKKFKAADADKDGFVTPEELKAAKGKKPAGKAKKAEEKKGEAEAAK